MAYPTVSAPYGLQPINRFDGMPYAGATQQLPIASTYNTAIFNGDIVYVTGGTIAKSVVTSNVASAANTATYGVFTGVEFLIPCAFFITIIVGLISAIAIFNYKDYYQILISIGWLSLIIIGFLVYKLSNENLMLGWGGVTIILANISLIAVGAISKSKDDHH